MQASSAFCWVQAQDPFAVTVGFSLADCRSDSWVVRRGMRPEASQAAGVIICILIFL